MLAVLCNPPWPGSQPLRVRPAIGRLRCVSVFQKNLMSFPIYFDVAFILITQRYAFWLNYPTFEQKNHQKRFLETMFNHRADAKNVDWICRDMPWHVRIYLLCCKRTCRGMSLHVGKYQFRGFSRGGRRLCRGGGGGRGRGSWRRRRRGYASVLSRWREWHGADA